MTELTQPMIRLLRRVGASKASLKASDPALDMNLLRDARAQGYIDHGGASLKLTPLGRRILKKALSEGLLEAPHPLSRAGAGQVNEGSVQSQSSVPSKEASRKGPLGWLAGRQNPDGAPLLSREQVVAGETLQTDYEFGQLTRSLRSNWRTQNVGGGTGQEKDLTSAALSARRRTEQALAAIGPELSGVVVDVCCFGKGLQQVEFERQWPARTARVVLSLGLSSLARHYGMSASASDQKRRCHKVSADSAT